MITFASSNLDVRYSFVPRAAYVSHSITPRFIDRDISFSLVTKRLIIEPSAGIYRYQDAGSSTDAANRRSPLMQKSARERSAR
jgi:hypothetical protein